MSGLGTVYKKEVRENLRDRRSLFNSVLLGPILFPILFIGLAYFASSKQQESVEKTLEVPVVGAQNAPNLVGFLEQQGVVIQAAPKTRKRPSEARTCRSLFESRNASLSNGQQASRRWWK